MCSEVEGSHPIFRDPQTKWAFWCSVQEMERSFLEVLLGRGTSRKQCHGKWHPRVTAVANCSLLGYLLGGQELSVWQSQPCLVQTENNSLVADTFPAESTAVPADSPTSAVLWGRILHSILCSNGATAALMLLVTCAGDIYSSPSPAFQFPPLCLFLPWLWLPHTHIQPFPLEQPG